MSPNKTQIVSNADLGRTFWSLRRRATTLLTFLNRDLQCS